MIREHPNVAVYRRTDDAFRPGDFDAIGSIVADDIVWHLPARTGAPQDIRGFDALVAWLRGLSALRCDTCAR
jgi:ketosteroid isomerase-like protein